MEIQQRPRADDTQDFVIHWPSHSLGTAATSARDGREAAASFAGLLCVKHAGMWLFKVPLQPNDLNCPPALLPSRLHLEYHIVIH
jgi:hypothetical protein